jgi:hypothetical protein
LFPKNNKKKLLATHTTTDFSGSAAMVVRSSNKPNQFTTAGRMERSDRPYNNLNEN